MLGFRSCYGSRAFGEQRFVVLPVAHVPLSVIHPAQRAAACPTKGRLLILARLRAIVLILEVVAKPHCEAAVLVGSLEKLEGRLVVPAVGFGTLALKPARI
ncbi:hypothetical protein D6B98_15210 [Bradyrhizobium sp. LVM 105]|nr:hypothetical protein D6B98_15210 [Bradyrhizobium sp. LVM 105]